jgi:hypothetical protein
MIASNLTKIQARYVSKGAATNKTYSVCPICITDHNEPKENNWSINSFQIHSIYIILKNDSNNEIHLNKI